MPIYEYECRECGHVFDALQKMMDEPLKDCPDCGRPELRKLLSAPNFRLKGGGWYETDFKDRNKRNLAGDGAKDSSSDAKPSGKAADVTGQPKTTSDTGAAKASKASGDSSA